MAESEWYTLPDGRQINIPANATRGQLDGLFSQLAQEYPTTIGTYYNSYTSPSQNEDGNLFGEVLEGLKGIPKGFYGTMFSGIGGIAGVLTPGKDTAFERKIRKTQDNIQKLGRNDKYADSYIAKLGQGLGSGAAYWAGIGALRPLQMGKYVPQAVKGLSPQAGRAASDLASRMGVSGSRAAGTGRFVKGTLDQAAMIAPFSVPIQWGQHASQVADYEERTGEDVSAAKELLGYGMTIPLALTEAIGIGSLGGLAPGAFGKSALKSGLMAGAKMGPKGVPAWKSFASGALEESAQESVQTIGAAAVAQALYDDEAYENLGAQLWEAATVGGGAGGVMALLLNGYTRRVGGNAFNLNNAAAQRIKRDELRKGGRTEDTTPGIPETRHTKATAGFGLANPNLTEEERIEQAEKRKEYHLDQIAIEQQVNAQEDSEYTVLSPQELEQEAVLRVERDLARDQKLYEESQEREAETKAEVGVTFPELDDIGGMPLEEIIQRLEDGEITPEMFEEIWTSDRLSRAGNDKREELREFVIRNSSAHNQYDAGAIAALVFGGHTDLVKDAENSESLFGEGTAEEQWQTARELLAQYLSPELAVKLVGETTEPESRPATQEELEAFEAIGVAQRGSGEVEKDGEVSWKPGAIPGSPEHAHLQVYDSGGTGVLGYLAEHVGDLTHRMTQWIAKGTPSRSAAISRSDMGEKISTTLTLLDDIQRFESQVAEQIENNAEYSNIPLETQQANLDAALATYAEAHRALPAYNEMQRVARDAAVAVGEKNFGEAKRLLQQLQTIIRSPDYETALHSIEVPGRVTAPRENLAPSEVNEMIEEANQNIENFDKGKAYDAVYGFQGGVDLYERAHILHQDRRAQWRERDGQLELHISDELDQKVLAKGQQDTLETVWNKSKAKFNKAVNELLVLKNITLPGASPIIEKGESGLNSSTFKALVSAVTGRSDGNIGKLEQGQRKALYGHIFNMPTFSTATLLPDLSPRTYAPQHMSNVIGRLAAIRDIGTAKGSSLTRDQLAEDLVNEDFSLDQLNQLLRHLQEGKYIEYIKGSRYKLVENNRSHARGPADVAREEDVKQRAERLRLEEAAEAQRNDTSTKLQSFISDLKQELEAHMKKRGLSQSGIGHQLSADLDGMWDIVLGENGVVENPQNMQDLLVEFDGPNAKILLNLSAIDPSNMSVDQIIQQFDTKIWKAFEEYGYYFQDEIESMDAQAQNKFVSEGMWQEFDVGSEYQEVTYEDFSKLVVPDATAGDARALFMEDLSKGRVDKTKSAGKVAHLKKGILGYLNNSIEATQDNPLVDVLRIFSAVETGALGLRGPGLSSLAPNAQIRNLTILQGVDPRHLSALKRALETGDTESEEKILDLISNDKEADIRLADAPSRTWDQEIFDEAMYQKELEDTNPGEIPPVGINASETAKESYYRLKRGEKPYVMPQALKEKYRRRVSFEPTKKMSELLKKYGHPEISADNRLTSEVVIDNVIDMGGLPGTTHESSLEEVRAAITRQRDIWKEPLPFIKSDKKTGIASWNMVHTKALWKHLRDMYAFSGIPIQDQARLKEQLSMELSRLADTAPIAGLHFRNNSMNLSMSGNALGGTQYIGTVENGYIEFKTFEGDEVTIDEAIAMLPNKQDREYASLYLGALRFLAYENNIIQAESLLEQATQKQEQVRQRLQTVVEGALGQGKKDEILSIEQLQRRITKAVKSGQLPSETTDLMLQELQLAWDSSQQDNMAFFKENSKRREWKTDYKINADGSLESIPAKDLSVEEQVADAEELVREIESMGANEMFEGGKNIMAFSKAYQNVNENYNLPLLLATEQITPEMAEFLKGQAYAPLFKDIGMMASHPMGSNGLMRTVGLEFTQLKQQSGSVFDNALKNFSELQGIDIVTNIQYSQLAMIRDGLTNITARRTLNDAQALAKLGQGKHSLFLGTDKKHAGPTVLRVQVKGQEQYHLMADPLMAESVMISGFNAPHLFFKAARFAARLQRHMIVDFPAFIVDNFVRDQGQFDQLFGGSTGSWTPLGPVIKGIKTANRPDALLESRKLGLVTGGGGAYRLVSDLAEGGSGTFGETGAAIAQTLGEKLGIKSERFSRAQVSVDQARQRKRYAELMEEKKATGKFNFDNMTAADRYALIKIYYEHAQQLSESTARKQAADISLARTGGNTAQAMLDGLEVMNFGRHGRSPTINMLTSLIPFMGGGITGLDTYVRGNFGSTDAPGAHLVSRTPEEFNRDVRQATWDRGFQVMVATMIYLMLVTGTDAYEEADETKKANNYIIPLPNHKSAALPIAFATGSFYKAIPEMIFRSILEEDYTLKDDAGPGAMKQLRNQFNFHVTPQILRPLWQASRNQNDYTKEKIVPSYMEELDPEYQRNDYTSDSAALLAKTFTWLPDFLGGKQLSSPMKMEFLLRQYFGQAATYGMFALDRTGREITGKNTVGTRYEGMDNFPVIGEFIDDTRKGRRSQETFYDLKDEMDVYTQMVNTLSQQNDPKKLQEYMEKHANLAQYKSIIASYNRYMVKWRTARDNLLKNPNIGDAEKRRILLSMMEERQKTLKGIAEVSAGVKGVK